MPDDIWGEPESIELQSVIERYDDRPDTCTIFRSDVPAERQPETAVTATEGWYVDLETVR